MYVQKNKNFIAKMNQLGKARTPFIFLIDFQANHPEIYLVDDQTSPIFWKTPHSKRELDYDITNQSVEWNIFPPSFKSYEKGFDYITNEIINGNSYLVNYTKPTKISTNLELEEIFIRSNSLYKIYYKDKFVSFSPEIFIQITDGKIKSFPMKGTIDAMIENAESILLNDEKEAAEHATIVDLIRNDLSIAAKNVNVKRFKYIDTIQTNRGNLLQMSSEIEGELPKNYAEKLGDIIFSMLPAGSITGAPKKKTMEIIKKAEQYNRGYYTGVFGTFDGSNLNSCVLIRYIEKTNDGLVYKSGGGITAQSNIKNEYDELIKKVYLPFS